MNKAVIIEIPKDKKIYNYDDPEYTNRKPALCIAKDLGGDSKDEWFYWTCKPELNEEGIWEYTKPDSTKHHVFDVSLPIQEMLNEFEDIILIEIKYV